MRAGRRWGGLEAATARRHNFFAFGVALNLWSRSSQWAALLSWRAMVAGRRRDEATLQWAIETILDRSRRRAFLGWGAFLVRRRVQSHQLSTAVSHWRGDVALMPAFATLHHHAQTLSAAAITVRRWRFTTLSFAVREWREAAERRGALVATLGAAVLRWRLANVSRLLRSWRAEAALRVRLQVLVPPSVHATMRALVIWVEHCNDLWTAAQSHRGMMQRAAAALLGRAVAPAFGTWRDAAAARIAALAPITRVVAALTQRRLRVAANTWRVAAAARRAASSVVARGRIAAASLCRRELEVRAECVGRGGGGRRARLPIARSGRRRSPPAVACGGGARVGGGGVGTKGGPRSDAARRRVACLPPRRRRFPDLGCVHA